MTELKIFSAGESLAVGTAYDSSSTVYTKVFAVEPGPMTLLFNVGTGPTTVELELSFATGGSLQSPPAGATDTNWFSLAGLTGAAVSTVVSIPSGSRVMVDPSARGLAADDTLKWGGRIPPYVRWMRARIKRTGGTAPNALVISAFCNTPNYSS